MHRAQAKDQDCFYQGPVHHRHTQVSSPMRPPQEIRLELLESIHFKVMIHIRYNGMVTSECSNNGDDVNNVLGHTYVQETSSSSALIASAETTVVILALRGTR